jgi:hypothetical protein
MIKTLIHINADLASSIALRFTCQLPKLTDVLLQTMHVVEPAQEGHSPGTGWVRRTWEKGLLETAQVEISRLINAERATCPTLSPPKMSIGVREDELLRELEEGSYDLFVEGLLHSYDSSYFSRKLRSRLYREAPTSILLVKNLAALRKIVLILENGTELQPLIATFLTFFKETEIEVDLLRYRFQSAGRVNLRDKREAAISSSSSNRREPDEILRSAERMLAAEGWNAKESLVVQDTPVKTAEYLQDYSLVVSFLPRQKALKDPLVDLLARVPSAILFCRG